ncbi:MAG: diaminopimelate epimerase [Clostridiales bacterium]|nr:diaminopimelate epimerase [Clostridiales bacterium]
MKFTKMEGLGNDYVYVNCFNETVENPSEVSIKVSDRHFGIGSDGLILIKPSEVADFCMEMYNADGSQSEMCGNGIRCVAKYVYDYGLTDKTSISVETLAGIKYLDLQVENGKVVMVTVNMGAPELVPANIPVKSDKDILVREPIEVAGVNYEMTCVSMGNPHCIVFVEDTAAFPLEKVGPEFEKHEVFPNRVNAEFIEVLDRKTVNMRVWERGSGKTLACGTGACASTVACILNGLTEDEITLHLLGGDLKVRWDKDENLVYMTGPAKVVFDGEINL